MMYAIIGLVFLVADQALKFWTVRNIELNALPGVKLIPGVLHLTNIKNTGIAFGLFGEMAALRWILLVLLAVFAAFIVLGILKGYLRTGFARWTGALLLAGLVSNGIDRTLYGFVTDMFEPQLFGISWPIFNIADCLVTVCGILFCVAALKGGIGAPKKRKRKGSGKKGSGARPAQGAKKPARSSGERKPRSADELPVRAAETKPAVKPAESGRRVSEDTRESEPQRAVRPAPRAAVTAPKATVSTPRAAVIAPNPKIDTPKPVAPQTSAVPEVKASEPAVSAAKPAVSAAKPAAPKNADDFDLDSILAEFK